MRQSNKKEIETRSTYLIEFKIENENTDKEKTHSVEKRSFIFKGKLRQLRDQSLSGTWLIWSHLNNGSSKQQEPQV